MKKRKKKKKNFYFFGNIVLLIVLALLINKMFFSNKNNESKNEVTDEEFITEEQSKLRKLNNINEKIDFFNMDYLDRYVKYKEEHKDLDDETIVVYVNIGLDQKFYTDVVDSPNKYTNTVIANKHYFLGSDYVPKNLTDINIKYAVEGKKLEYDAAKAFEKMAAAAEKEGYTIRAVSTYRSYNYQQNLYNNYARSDGEEKADTYSARAGYSEHQTGLAADVDNGKVSYTSFGDTKEFKWMQENCYKYGFILRYTKENEFITGYMNEPWHYRYVGVDIATYIHEHPMTYEEYFVRFLEKK